MENKELGGIGKLSRQRLSEVVRHFKGCFKASDVSDCLQISKAKARALLAQWAKNSWLQRIRPGVYVAVELASESSNDIFVDPWSTAMQLYSPCYIGGWSSSEYWGFTDQIFRSTIILTSKRINGKYQTVDDIIFLLKKQDIEKFFGFKIIWRESVKVLISDPHKTMIDMLDDPALAGGIRSLSDMLLKYIQSEHLNYALLVEYASRMKNKTIFKRLGYLLSILKPQELSLIELCHRNISQGNSQIDPSIKGNQLIKKWGLWLPNDFKTILSSSLARNT